MEGNHLSPLCACPDLNILSLICAKQCAEGMGRLSARQPEIDSIPLKIYLFILFLTLLPVLGLMAQAPNRPVPVDFYSYEFRQESSSTGGHYLSVLARYQTIPSTGFRNAKLTIFDPDGYLFWYAGIEARRCVDFKYFPAQAVYSFTIATERGVEHVLLDPDLNSRDTIRAVGRMGDIHDFLIAANGNYILPTSIYDTLDLSAFIFDSMRGSSQTIVKGFGIQEIDPSGKLVFEWTSLDHIPPDEADDHYGFQAELFDYCHGNAIAEDLDGHLLVSMRQTNTVYKISRKSGAIIWRLGGKGCDFSFPNDAGFSGQHDIRVLGAGHYSLFDNAVLGKEGHSRAVEYVLDTVGWTATRVRSYQHRPAFLTERMGSYRAIPGGGRILGFGLRFRPNPNIALLDTALEVVSEFYFQDSVVSYRVRFQEIPEISRPLIRTMKTATGWELTAPDGMSEYVWSTGEGTQSIFVAEPQTVQVWVPQGIGYIGSKPVILGEAADSTGK
jgi:hypothetical protein